MTFPRLSERLETALSLVPDGAVVFDVGSDRGDFLLALEAEGNKAYGCENKMGPYDGLIKNLKANQSKVKVFLQDGISFLPKEVDCLTILGMGGRTIRGILERGKKNLANVKDLIVSPQSCVEETIDFLSENGYQNIAGKYIRETRYYPVLLFHKMGDYPILLDEGERCYGAWPLAQKDPLLLDMLRQRLSLLNTLPPTKKNLCEKMDLERRIASWN